VRRVEQDICASLPGLGRQIGVRTALMAVLAVVAMSSCRSASKSAPFRSSR
jgi:hypothetical protein